MRDVNPWTRARLEVAAVLLTGALHLAPLENYFPEIWFIVMVAAGWLSYAARRVCRERSELDRWGLGLKGLWQSALAAFLVGAFGLGCMALTVFFSPLRDRAILWHPDMLWLFLFYPVWGLFQQFCVQALIAGNIARARPNGTTAGAGPSAWVIALITGPLFGIVHAPNWPLVGCTAIMGFAFTLIYLRWRNLWPLGLVHGLMGVPTYFWLLGVNPLAMVLA